MVLTKMYTFLLFFCCQYNILQRECKESVNLLFVVLSNSLQVL